jgi:apolipoprotein N-acyltransferase
MPRRSLSIEALAERVTGLRGWRRRAAAFAAGLASVLAMAPVFCWPVLWLTLPILVWLIDGVARDNGAWRGGKPRAVALAAAEIGWWFGFGYLLAGLFWIGEAFLVEAEKFAVLMPFAVLLLPAALALYYGLATGVASWLWRTGPIRVLALALAVSAAEWARGHLLSGFPWNVLGYALTYPLPLMQSAALVGIYGLTLLAVLVFALPPVLWASATRGPEGRRWPLAAVATAVLPLTVAALYGEVRLATTATALVPGVKIRIVQPSVPQREKWRPESQERIFFDHIDLSQTDGTGQIDNLKGISHVVWPEAAMPFLPLDQPGALAAIGRLLPAGTLLISGALRAEPPARQGGGERRVYNSMLVFGEGGALVARYDKIHLVPFGEYLPLWGVLEKIGLRQLAHVGGSFATGKVPRPLLPVPGLPAVAGLICYEAIFPHAIVQGDARPGVLLNLTNDGWFGNTSGPRQHLHQAQVRAVEEGLPLIRVANNGISASIGPLGRFLGRLELDVRGTLDTPLPHALPPPLYARFGDALFFAFWLLGACILAVAVRRKV